MPATSLTQAQVGNALANCGHYRVTRAQLVAREGAPDLISGSTVLALGMRETSLRNIQGGAKFENGQWVAQDDPNKMDVGVFQISREHNMAALRLMPGVANGTWGPVVPGKTAADSGYVPRYEESLRFTIENMREAIAFAQDHNIPSVQFLSFGIAAHNAGIGGALNGWRLHGDVDYYTTHADYSSWVLRHRSLVNQWLGDHPNWRA